MSQVVPFSGGGDGAPFTVEGHEPMPGEPKRDTWMRSITPDYFATMGIPLLKGRPFQGTDTETAQPVAIVDEKLARTYWPDEDPVGKRIRIGDASNGAPWLTVVGVVASVKNRSLEEDAKFYLYQPFSQSVRNDMSVVLRTAGEPEALVPIIRGQVSSLDSELPLFEISTMEKAVARSLGTRRIINLLLTGFAAAALLLAALGIYGVMSLNVGSRVNEFGIRMALGARPADLLKLVIREGLFLIFVGLAVGIAVASVLTRSLSGLLYGVSGADPVTFTSVSLLLAGVGALACYLPARRASRVDPLVALRNG
jgi:predicted permease